MVDMVFSLRQLRWPHPKRHPLWRAGIREKNHWLLAAAIQGHLHETHEDAWHRCSLLGGPCSWPHDKVENQDKYHEPTPQGGETDEHSTHRRDLWGRVCLSCISLFSHRRHCSSQAGSQDASPMVSHDWRSLHTKWPVFWSPDTTVQLKVHMYVQQVYTYSPCSNDLCLQDPNGHHP